MVSRNEIETTTMNHLSQTIPISQTKLKEMKYDFRMGLVGIAIIFAIGIAFSTLFTFNAPKPNLAGTLFGFAPLFAVSTVALYLAYHLRNDWLDIKAGYKIPVTGTIEDKFIKVRRASGSTTLTSISERTRHFIKLDTRRYLITATDYEKCQIGNRIKMQVTPYGKSVIDFEVLI